MQAIIPFRKGYAADFVITAAIPASENPDVVPCSAIRTVDGWQFTVMVGYCVADLPHHAEGRLQALRADRPAWRWGIARAREASSAV
jgi:hypothetical protein